VLTDIKSVTDEELQAQFQAWEHPSYRVQQLLEWVYVHRASDWESMTNLPKKLREDLGKAYGITSLELVRTQGSRDATQKYLWRLSDHSLIESVLIPANPALYGEPSDRHTLCVSTQVGCAYGCKFCASGLGGFKRNLRVEEIVDQFLAVERNAAGRKPKGQEPGARGEIQEPPREASETPQPALRNSHSLVSNLVIMGMGEPLANYENLIKALKILNAPWGGGIGARKITISTSGLAPQIRRLADEPYQFRLAISLHGATDETRNRLMPVNRKYPLRELAAACDYYQQKKGRMLTFEYILIRGINDHLREVKPLAALALRLNAKINLIPCNQVEGLPWERPDPEVQEAFLAALEEHKVAVTLRREKGDDIDAACGQLRLKTERELAARL
jgi:23S rRNA (adenine2503-C2)-methyltransferase